MSATMPHLQLDNTFGAMLIGVFIAGGLWGVTCLQTWYYYYSFPKDRPFIKYLVAAALISDTIHQALISHALYHYTITNFANPAALADMVWSVLLEIAFNAITGVLAQGFLTWRCYRLTNGNVFITGFIAAVIAAEFVASLAFTGLAMKLKTFQQLKQLNGLSMSINVLGAVGSVLIAATLVVMLSRLRTGYRNSDSAISKWILFAVNTGLLTSLDACLSLITILALPNALVYACFYFLLGKLYSNAMLAYLNARKSVDGMPEDGDTVLLELYQDNVRDSTAEGGSKGSQEKVAIVTDQKVVKAV